MRIPAGRLSPQLYPTSGPDTTACSLAPKPRALSLRIGIEECLWVMILMLMKIAEVERSIENLVKSGKMFGIPGGRREFKPPFSPGPARNRPKFGEYICTSVPAGPHPSIVQADTCPTDPRGSGGPQRPQSVEFDGRSGPPSSNLQNFYASQRHQTSRGSNEAEQMMQAKRRMAAQRERELRNYHQEQQYNRSRPPSSV